jgi:hypothetical protein
VIQRRCIGNSTLLPIALGHDPVHVHGLSDEGGDGGATDTEFERSVWFSAVHLHDCARRES